MVSDERTAEAEERSSQTDGSADGASEREQPAEREHQGGAAGGAADWSDLDAYCAQLRAEHAAWAERLDAVQTQLAHLRPALLGIASQYRALAIEEDLERLNQLVLGGVAMAQSVRLGYDLERYISLFWPVAGDPRPGHAQPDGDGEYRVDIYFLVGPDGRGRVRVEGEKRLEAPLPTTRERIRRVLLGAIQAPKRVVPGGDGAEGDAGASAGAPSDTPASGAGPGAAEADASAERRTEVGTDEPVPAADPRPGDPNDQPPPEEQVIPLGPAGDAEPSEKPKRRGKKS